MSDVVEQFQYVHHGDSHIILSEGNGYTSGTSGGGGGAGGVLFLSDVSVSAGTVYTGYSMTHAHSYINIVI